MEAHSANILRKSGRGASRGGICSGRCGAGGRMGAGAACADGLPMVGRSEFSGNGLRWSVGRRPRKRMCGISGGGGCRVADRGLGPVCSWSRQGVGMSGVGRCAADRRCRVVGQQGGCRAGVGPVRAGADRWARRGPAWTLCSGEAGMEPLPFPNGAGRIPRTEPLFRRGASLPAGPASGRCGPLGATRVGVDPLFRRGRHGAASVSGRAGRIPRTQGLPSSRAAPSGRGPMLRFRTLFVLFCSVPPRRNRRRLQIRGFAAREKRKSCFFIFTL